MAIPEQSTTCTNCNKPVPAGNIDLHTVHCSRKLEKCKLCGSMVPKKLVERHYSNAHSPVDCKLCNETVERANLNLHKYKSCPLRIVTCQYCGFRIPYNDLIEHQEFCWNKKQVCQRCRRRISSGGNARNVKGNWRRGLSQAWSQNRLFVTVVAGGIFALLGLGLFQRKNDDLQTQQIDELHIPNN